MPRPPSVRGSGITLVPVKVEQTGGSAGDESSPCTFTYDVWQLGQDPDADTPIATDLTPLDHERTAVGRYRWNTYGAQSWNYGTAFRDAGEWKLWQVAGEVAEYTTCSVNP